MQLVIAGGGIGRFRGIAQDVLIAEFCVDFGIDFVERFFFGDFKEARTGSLGHLCKDFLTVGVFLGAARIASSAAATGKSAASLADARVVNVAAVAFLIREENAVDQGVGALRGFDGFSEGFFAAVVDAVGED